MICHYCEKDRVELNLYGSIDNDFDYSCIVCNLEYLNWYEGNDKHTPYNNDRLDKAVKVALAKDKLDNNTEWKPHLKTIAERSEIFQPGAGVAIQ